MSIKIIALLGLLSAGTSTHWENIKKFQKYSDFLHAANAAKAQYQQADEPEDQVQEFPSEADLWLQVTAARPEIHFKDKTKTSSCVAADKHLSAIQYNGGERKNVTKTLYFGVDVILPTGYDAKGNCMAKKLNLVQHFVVTGN